jgi:hypothetical protein
VAISGLRSGAVGGGVGRSGRTRQGVPAVTGLGEEAEAGPLSELGEHVPGFYAEPAREFPLRDPVTGNVVRTGRTRNLYERSLIHGRDPVLGQFRFRVEYLTNDKNTQTGFWSRCCTIAILGFG